ncbi:MAG: putative acetyltransferase [Chloroflexi bacterium]|nr:MAG: putative acetyltransferase [Chloroflexota bacterium]MBA4376211.1 N-acetyltransferase [Anaerolinea sp.]
MITGKRVRLRAIERDDIPNFVRWLNDREVIEFLLMNSPLSKAMEEKWFEGHLAAPITSAQVMAIEALSGDQWVHIGNTGIHNIEPVHNAAEFGIFIGEKDFWNKGYGREATLLTLKHGFEDLNLNRIFLNVYENNLRGIAAYKAAGFVHEGVLREAVYKNGRYLDVLVMSVLHSEWKGS